MGTVRNCCPHVSGPLERIQKFAFSDELDLPKCEKQAYGASLVPAQSLESTLIYVLGQIRANSSMWAGLYEQFVTDIHHHASIQTLIFRNKLDSLEREKDVTKLTRPCGRSFTNCS